MARASPTEANPSSSSPVAPQPPGNHSRKKTGAVGNQVFAVWSAGCDRFRLIENVAAVQRPLALPCGCAAIPSCPRLFPAADFAFR